VVILELIHANNPDFSEGMYLLDTKPIGLARSLVIHNNFTNRMTYVDDGSFKFLPYQLSMVG
jgi:hypothetical protein